MPAITMIGMEGVKNVVHASRAKRLPAGTTRDISEGEWMISYKTPRVVPARSHSRRGSSGDAQRGPSAGRREAFAIGHSASAVSSEPSRAVEPASCPGLPRHEQASSAGASRRNPTRLVRSGWASRCSLRVCKGPHPPDLLSTESDAVVEAASCRRIRSGDAALTPRADQQTSEAVVAGEAADARRDTHPPDGRRRDQS